MGAMSARTLAVRAFAMTALAAAIVAVALPASAHAELVSSIPADGATLTELTSIHLEFSEDLLDIGNSIAVTDGAGTHDLTVTVTGATLDAPVSGLVPGDITIAWRSASVDDHTEEGELHVTLSAPEPSASPSPTPTVTVTATASPTPSATPSASPTADATDASGGVSPWLWGLLGLAVIGGAAAAIVAATRQPPSES
jgi:methionine-rich copper-binding protein CopC